ncbi:Orotidine 5'-phosphate decarboxylase [hydrothermal vent metagenome]|uniref:Orotidine 5'-phosphate decarboxylase n=1 Tax=hydrothermal vent metagenome TaxID=652676 RepID=A0A3B1E5R5_9ZZZZ
MELCVALDLPSSKENLNLANKIKDHNIWLKVGFRTYIRNGKEFLRNIKSINPNFKIFLDLKLYDIPNTMADASEEICNLNVDMFNIHASCGKIAMSTVVNRISKFKKPPLVLAVTALTSFDNNSFKNIYNEDLETKTMQFAQDAHATGLDGVVCSVFESLSIKQHTHNDFITLTPGIRPFNEESQDQKRVADISEANNNLVDFIVVGRPIYTSKNPDIVVKNILSKLL